MMENESLFPNPKWLDYLVGLVKRDPDRLKDLGIADFRLAIKIEFEDGSDKTFGLILDGYDVDSQGEISGIDSFKPEATLSGSFDAFKEMLDNIVENRGADKFHTLNTLCLAEFPLRISSDDPIGRDKVYRYAETLQVIFDSLGLEAAKSG